MTFQRITVAAIATILVAACQSTGSNAQSASPSNVATASPGVSAASSPSLTPSSSAAPDPSEVPVALAPPPPTAVKMTTKGSDPGGVGYDTRLRVTISWKEVAPKGTEIRVYGVTKCFAPPAGGPCLVEHTPLPESVRELIATAPASKGSVSWTWPNWEDVGGAVMAHGSTIYEAVVIAAYNADGHSKFIIVESGEWCPDCTY
jgi:hypothetical protein